MAKTLVLDWRDLVYHETKKDNLRYGGTGDYIYKGHLEEAFTACIRFIREHHPTATLNHLGSDMGGEIYEVTEEE